MLIPLIIIATFLLVLLIYYYYYYYHKVEKFTDPDNNLDSISAALNGIISGDIIAQHPYVEKLSDIRSNSQLKIYLTSFSERTNYDNSVKVYLPEMSRWNNFIKENETFYIASTQRTMPIIRPGGMPLNNISLQGIPSDELAIANTQNALPSFSATFFINFTAAAAAVFEIPVNGFELFEIYLESPNYSRLSLKNGSDNNNCILELELGNGLSNTLSTGDILKSVLMSGTNVIAITITCNITSGEIAPHIYIGSISSSGVYSGIGSYTMDAYTPTKSLTLGNSQITINKKKDPLNASLLAFLYYSKEIGFEEHKSLTTYLTSQNTSLPVITTVLESASDKLREIKNYISNNTRVQDSLQDQLAKCKASIPPVVKAFGHNINMDGISSVSTEDLRACSVLEIKDRLKNAVASAPRFQISLPPDIPEGTPAIEP